LADDATLRTLTFWNLGSLNGASYPRLWPLLLVALLVACWLPRRADALNALLLGESEARHLGFDVERLKAELVLCTALGVGAAVAAAGMIGFIGLVVPHLIRLVAGPDHRTLLPASMMAGAILLLRLLTCVLLVMVLGFWLGDALQERLGLVLPSYVGAMFIAIVLRNLDDRLGWLRIPDHAVGTLGDVCLGIFLTMAMMSLKFWELENLGLPLLGVLFIQVAVLLLLTIFALFRLLGRNYDAAVLCAGFLGHGLGATPNAVANMGAVCEHYRVFSHKAFIIVPLCGAVLIDLVAIPAITWFINAFS
ncbi:iron chelate uptake ABC transporter family permease subunit, partial [Pseudomonas aeruginosa]|nr:iron chelate uptake ABC transporter family permease subunit [Pseudomonas aeruginosa]